jgi:hypothetical protein
MNTVRYGANAVRGFGRLGRPMQATTLLGGLLVGLVAGTPQAWAQWTTSGSNISYSLGNVGIGTTSPSSKAGWTPLLNLSGSYSGMVLNSTAAGGRAYSIGSNVIGGAGILTFFDETVSATRMVVTPNGNVGIGTLTPAALLHIAGDVMVDGNLAAKYQDVAEWVRSSRDLLPATVVIIDPREANRVTISDKAYDMRVAGVVSEKPGLLLGEGGADKAKVAHSGRVKVKVDAQHGPIAVGDLLVTSARPGYAMRSEPVTIGGTEIHRPGTIIGKALESLQTGQGEILVLLTLQ